MYVSAFLAVLLATAHVLPADASSSSTGSSSEASTGSSSETSTGSSSAAASTGSSSEATSDTAETILAFVARDPAFGRRHLLDRPANTCGGGALPKDKELGDVNNYLFCITNSLGLRRVDATAEGLQITGGLKSFTVFVLGTSEQFAGFTAGTVCGFVVTQVETNVAGAYHPVNWDLGNKRVLEDNLRMTPDDGPSAIVACLPGQVNVNGVIDVNALAPVAGRRRSLLVEEDDLVDYATVAQELIDCLAAQSGISAWTAQGLALENGEATGTFVLFYEADETSAGAFEVNYDNISDACNEDGVVELGTPVRVPKEVVPPFTNTLKQNLGTPVSPKVVETLDAVQQVTAPPILAPAPAPAPEGR
eukprot:jgi/Tetstr1/428449/TSEL_018462.t1